METKKAKCTEVKPIGSPDQYGNNSFVVTFDNGDSGFHKAKEASRFTVGVEAEYVFETLEKKDKSGTYTKISPPKKDFKPFGGGGSPQLSIEDFALREKIKAVSFSMSYAKDLAESKVIELTKLSEYAKIILEWEHTQIDKVLKSNKG